MPSLRSASAATSGQRDSSYSKTWQTKRNWNGPPLHSNIKGRNDRANGTSDADKPAVVGSATTTMSEAEIHALPQSSDDEDDNIENTDPAASVSKSQPVSESNKRKSPFQSKAKRTKKAKLIDEPDVVDTKPDATSMDGSRKLSQYGPELNMFPTSTSQKKITKKYERPKAENRYAGSDRSTFKAPPQLPKQAIAPETSANKLRAPEPVSKPEPPKKVLKTYALSGSTLSSTPTSSGRDLDRSDGSPKSSPATTPVSNKIVDLEEEGQHPDTCPHCEKKVVRSRLSNPSINLIELKYMRQARQQEFCQQHSLADAKVYYEAQRFPTMNWINLKRRITKYIPRLKAILQREKPSHFLKLIDARIADMKNRKQIQRFLDDQGKNLDAFPPGYYGVKGIHIMAEVIAAELSHCLSGRDTDPALKALGVGPYVSFVLVPECTTCLVMDDMAVSEEDARTIMRESSQAGMLIHPEDDIVTRQDDD